MSVSSDPPTAATAPSLTFFITKLLPGLVLIAGLTLSALKLAATLGWPAPAIALLLGIGVALLPGTIWVAPAAKVASRTLLRWGIVLLGSTINFAIIRDIGTTGVLVTVVALYATLLMGILLGRAIGIDPRNTLLGSIGVAICGATAIMAVAAVVKRDDQKEGAVAYLIGLTTLAGSIEMLLLPVLAHLMGLSPHSTGIFLGAALHDLGQAAGAGYGVSAEVGSIAVATKLLRVACLAPTVILISRIATKQQDRSGPKLAIVPWYLVGFVAMMIARALGILPEVLVENAMIISQACIVASLIALGTMISFNDVMKSGWKPILLTASLSSIIVCLVLVFILGSKTAFNL
ncbi:YeiH family protein [Sphingobium boeckii]|uniref:Putative integral membrane protein (TIGR00698 family) n=1 Tax=Sphingobium boeckii TaxID=1082345 RepID=A0A7W9AG45_9SPHN|nr:putative sulfate exporter family transporter [Sphingobium boeckii]MBB5684834.1 putative integral membrane protein (TIGR00698 family) [Sphingobium boeckii]